VGKNAADNRGSSDYVPRVNVAAASLFSGDGPARAAARAVDWAQTSLGPPESWPTSLKTTVRMLLNCRHPMFLWWGPELIQIYNDAYVPSFGRGKHPAAMGQRGADCWQEIWPIIYPQIEDVMLRGKASWNESQLVPIFRNERLEEVYWSYGYSPVFDDAGKIAGTLVVCTEMTAGVLAVRRLDAVRELAVALHDAQDVATIARITAERLASSQLDIPFAVVELEGIAPVAVGLEGEPWPEMPNEASTGPMTLASPVICALWPEPVTQVIVHAVDGMPGAKLMFGLSPRLPIDAAYTSFSKQVVEQVGAALARVAVDVERRRLLLQAPVAAALMVGPEHVYEIANPRYVQVVNREVVGKRYIEAFPELIGTEMPDILARVYRTGEPFSTDDLRVPLAREPGGELEERHFQFNLEPIRDVRGSVYGMMVVAVDITAQATTRAALERTNAERAELLQAAQAASRAKDEFLAMLGHELRNPLAPILTALELMKAKNAPGTEREREIIQRQAKQMVSLIDDLLDVSRVVAGKIVLFKRRVTLSSVVVSAVEMVTPLLETQRHQLRLDVPSEGLEIDVDPARLAQVISNLLSNAARYTDAGGLITVRAAQSEDDVVLQVQDNGSGISAEQLPYLFERFFQAPRSGHRTKGGLGLGLALVKSLTELHGGSVSVKSDGPGRGSSFELRLPVARGQAPSLADATGQRLTPDAVMGERVLLVDDTEDITDLFGSFLQMQGFEVRTAQDGPTALRIASEYQPTVAVLDLGLPVMDGYEIAAQLLQQQGRVAPRLIAMSGYGQKEDVERTRSAGFEQHLVKPVSTDALLRAIAQR
jgi:signal transduction histidine kinase/CheY-like chemotaxis protein